jgi:serine/threonine protein kinase
LKPENILLNSENVVKLSDFGWSAVFNEEEYRETVCGTFEYMAPEIFEKKRQTKKTDIWALGILLYELMHGYAPY